MHRLYHRINPTKMDIVHASSQRSTQPCMYWNQCCGSGFGTSWPVGIRIWIRNNCIRSGSANRQPYLISLSCPANHSQLLVIHLYALYNITSQQSLNIVVKTFKDISLSQASNSQLVATSQPSLYWASQSFSAQIKRSLSFLLQAASHSQLVDSHL